jgi:imidazolonepropionase
MLLHSTSQLITLTGGPQRGAVLGRLGVIEDGAVLIRAGRIAAVGTSSELRAAYPEETGLNAQGRAVLPGFVDPHTHLVYAGDRAAEFEMRLQGKSYMEILAAGGGILSTVQATRAAGSKQLLGETRARARGMLAHGTTTAEAKTGYGLELNSELKQLKTLLALDAEGPLEIAPTFLAAHAIPPEYRQDPDGYVEQVCATMLPALRDWWAANAPGFPTRDGQPRPLPFVDVFCERGAFSLEQSRRILETARMLGFPLKIHADEFENLGGAALAAGLGAVSADHLVKTSPQDIHALASSPCAAVALPCTPFGLGETQYTPARAILEEGGLLALATDFNPGTAWCENMQFAIALACRAMHLTPAEALAAATINAAAAIGRADTLGSIEPGKQADLIMLKVADYRHLAYQFGGNLVHTVIKHGEIVL